MIAFSWNIRGLGARPKRSTIRKLIFLHQPSFVFIQETKLGAIHKKSLNTLWGDANLEWLHSPANGNSGGLLSFWKPDYFQISSYHIERHWIGLGGSILPINFKCVLINIYNSYLTDHRAIVWNEIVDFCSKEKYLCFIMGDFNEVLSPLDRGSGIISSQGSSDFQEFIHNLGLIEISPTNGKFT